MPFHKKVLNPVTPVGGDDPIGYEQITDLSTAQSLTVPTNANYALIQAEGDDLRWRDDGTAPTASVGMILPESTDIWYAGDMSAFQAIQINTGGKLNVSYYI